MEFLECCETAAEKVTAAISPLIGTEEGGNVIKMGADGTPTEAIDEIAEEIVIECFRRDCPCKDLISEEIGHIDMGGSTGTIYLDPVDGTHNAVTGNPFYALSVAYAESGVTKKAYVRDLAHGETFYAELGKGAYRDGKRVNVSATNLLEKSTISVYCKKFDPETILKIGTKIRRWRLYGASALELCYVGCGRLDGFIDLRNTLRVTDAAAGILFCTEAGGRVTDKNGQPVHFTDDVSRGQCLIATNGKIHNKAVEYLR
ncbi:MAG: bifunctional fructose-bisphosphatase/inositol-phosphate phosphatase [Methanomicrobium sp.]|uniref:bifunctional fructose-bisphosphatase/inositol-phosphate phosphatase n=1 Tax=Methanomicrobium mobile TaxID=2205 RepID=UPI0005B2EAB5|nr:bifunctional fructose-bisphosphatase/inositol-phosphate phosphatase [Methanomicrobium mobile]MBO7388020.1 bifunctional fructose-bisphosphatase/inositol-phosphate phosphatase [Methanomicrobium sp.]